MGGSQTPKTRLDVGRTGLTGDQTGHELLDLAGDSFERLSGALRTSDHDSAFDRGDDERGNRSRAVPCDTASLDRAGNEVLPAAECVARRAGRSVAFDGRSHYRTAGGETAPPEHVEPRGRESLDRCDWIIVSECRDQTGGYEVARVARRLLGELGLAAGEVVVDRPPGRAAVGEHIGERGSLDPLPAKEQGGALDHALA